MIALFAKGYIAEDKNGTKYSCRGISKTTERFKLETLHDRFTRVFR